MTRDGDGDGDRDDREEEREERAGGMDAVGIDGKKRRDLASWQYKQFWISACVSQE